MKTARKDTKVVEVIDSIYGSYALIDERHVSGGLDAVIQTLADEGYDFLGKIDEFKPTGSVASPSKTYLFAKERA